MSLFEAAALSKSFWFRSAPALAFFAAAAFYKRALAGNCEAEEFDTPIELRNTASCALSPCVSVCALIKVE